MFIYQGSIISTFLSQNGQQYKIPVYLTGNIIIVREGRNNG